MGRRPKEAKEAVKYPGVRSENGRHTYRYSVPIPGKKGRKQKETPSYPTAKEAFEAGIKIKAQLLNGTYFEERDIIFDDFVIEWLKMYEATGKVKNTTVDIRMRELKKCKKYFGHKKIGDISKKDYQKMLDDQKKQEYSLNSIKLLHSACSLVFKKAVDLEMIKSDPTSSAEIPTYQATVEELENKTEIPKYMEKEELTRFLNVVKEHGDRQDFNLFYLIAYTGMRIGEMSALNKNKDINRAEKFISITKTLYCKKKIKEYVINTPKTKASRREIDITDSVVDVLDDQIAWLNEFKMANRKTYYDAGFLFVNTRRNPGYPEAHPNITSRMKTYLEIAGLPLSLTPHSLRHTHVSLLAEVGVALETIQKRMGHSSDEVTRLIYLHVTKKRRKEAPEKFEKLMNSL
ncbi:tyrosine-type recombinase/integrase [Paenibacillus sp. FSL L8-0708]|uniref:tyrosine-type recombinase/integrase n=1 Tax=Paenibacillus sp. FSL L8-0708 TaxID=2975311 RepID=UPI0030F830D8